MMHLAMRRRKAAEELQYRTTMTVATMTAAMHANTNLDSQENQSVRAQTIREIHERAQEQFETGLAAIYGVETEDHDAIDLDDPWWAAERERLENAKRVEEQ